MRISLNEIKSRAQAFSKRWADASDEASQAKPFWLDFFEIFGILTSNMHNAWMRFTCGRLKSDYHYSASIVYNNFPWPDATGQALSDAQHQAIEQAAQAVLDARAQFAGASLADLYDPLSMPPTLLKAHQKLDAAVDKAYESSGGKNDAERVAFLFGLYEQVTGFLLTQNVKDKKSGKKNLSQ